MDVFVYYDFEVSDPDKMFLLSISKLYGKLNHDKVITAVTVHEHRHLLLYV